jgi:hypothetical protein
MADGTEKRRNLGRPYFATQIKGRKANFVWPSWIGALEKERRCCPEVTSSNCAVKIAGCLFRAPALGIALSLFIREFWVTPRGS